jgi:hypothetical protein
MTGTGARSSGCRSLGTFPAGPAVDGGTYTVEAEVSTTFRIEWPFPVESPVADLAR